MQVGEWRNEMKIDGKEGEKGAGEERRKMEEREMWKRIIRSIFAYILNKM